MFTTLPSPRRDHHPQCGLQHEEHAPGVDGHQPVVLRGGDVDGGAPEGDSRVVHDGGERGVGIDLPHDGSDHLDVGDVELDGAGRRAVAPELARALLG